MTMEITVDNILESISNPQGKFRTLEGIYAAGDNNGIPYHTFSDPFVRFLTVWNGKSRILLVPLTDTSKMKEAFELAGKTKSPYLIWCSYIEAELTVFDDNGQPHSLDVIVYDNPPGRSLLDYVKEKCIAGDTAAVRRAFNAFIDMAKWLLGSGITHGRIKNRNLRINDAFQIKLLDYACLKDEPESTVDNKNIASIAVYLKAVCDDPRLVSRYGQVPPSVVVGKLENPGLMKSAGSRQELIAALESLRTSDETIIINDSFAEPEPGIGYYRVGALSDGLRRVERDGRFGFADENNNETIPAIFQFATMFDGGRSVVVLDDYFGLIDTTGKYILKPVCESIDWYADEGIVQMSMEGKFGMTDRNGKKIVPFIYEWMGEISEGMICVKSKGLYGFIDTSGKVTVEPRYTDADSFRDGKACVSLHAASFDIDHNGNRV